ncbi:MAG TPA: hypothetical protein VIV40_22170, partial [Kofleriaceae bacterium]
WPSAAFDAMRLLLQGQFAEHEVAVAEMIRLGAAAGDKFVDEFAAWGHRMTAARVTGDDDLLRRHRTQFEVFLMANRRPYFEIAAMLYVRLGELDEARAFLAAHPGLADEVRNHQLPTLGCYMAEVAWELHDRESATTLYDWLASGESPLAALHMHGFAVDRPTAHAAMQLAATLGDLAAARRHFMTAAAVLRPLDARPLEAWLQLDFARILIAAGDRGDEPRRLLASARAINEALGLKLARRIAAAEATLGAAPAAQPIAAAPVVEAPELVVQLRCEGEYWLLEGCGASCRIKGSKGVELLARLVGEPNREIHVLDLMGSEGADAGDAGEVIDKDARNAYRTRITELREALEQAEAWNDAVRAERARDELEALETELVRAAGLGGRTRRVGRAAERARINVQRRLADAMRRIAEVDAELGQHLSSAIRTGVYCSYAPERAARTR